MEEYVIVFPAWLLYTVGVIAIIGFLIFAFFVFMMIRFISQATESKAPPRSPGSTWFSMEDY